MSTRTVKYWQAVNRALEGEMERDESVVVFGQNVAKSGGTFGSTRGLLERFGPDRVLDTPISELASIGTAVGASLFGLKPVIEIVFSDFVLIGADQIVNQAAKARYFTGGSGGAPIVLKTGIGTGGGLGAQHQNTLEAWWAHVPGLKVVWPATPADAEGLLRAAIRDPDPVVFLESVGRYAVRGPASDGEPVPIGAAHVAAEGDDLTIVTYGTALAACLEAADTLREAGVAAEVIDLRTLAPWDVETVVASVRRTRRALVVHDAPRDFGIGAEVAAEVSERCFGDLAAPVRRLAAPRVPAPHVRQFEDLVLPSPAAVVAAARSLAEA